MPKSLDDMFAAAPVTVTHIDAKGRKYKIKFAGVQPTQDDIDECIEAAESGAIVSRSAVVAGAIAYVNEKGKLVRAKASRKLEAEGDDGTTVVRTILAGEEKPKPKPKDKTRDGKPDTVPPADTNGKPVTA
jgi:hypothetical protein